MSMLQQLMSSLGGAPQKSAVDPTAKEGRAAWRKLMENAVKEGNQKQIAALSGNAPEGVDPSIYTTIAGLRSPAQKAQTAVDNEVAQRFLQLINGGNPVRRTPATPTPTPTKPSFVPSSTIQAPLQTTPAQTTQPSEPDSRLFTDDILFRAAIKKYTGVTVGEHYFEAPQWFAEHKELTDSGMMDSDATGQLAAKYGFIPDGASHLVSTPEEKKALFERELSANLRNPVIHDLWKQAAPEKYWNNPKQKTAWLIDKLAGFGRYVPEHYQPFLDRFRGLEDPDFVSDELKSWAYQNTGKMPSELTPNDIANARKSKQNDHFFQTMQDSYLQFTGKTRAERELELSKPISAEDRAEQGIGSEIKTYRQLADEGKRFASDADRKMYQELYTARARLVGMRNLLFGTEEHPEHGIFTGIEKSGTARMAARGKLAWEKWNGTQRGRNLEEYNDYMAYFARTLIKIAGESGSRLSDQDIIGIMASMSDPGRGLTGVPDAEALAKSKYDHSVVDMERLMELLEETTTITAAPTDETDADVAAPEYEVNKIYIDAQGRKAKYLGEKEGKPQWQIQP